jgi:hyperosmotically inducible periplasmic protein
MKTNTRIAFLAVLPLALALGACSPDNTTTSSNASTTTSSTSSDSTVGQKVDAAAAKTQDELARAGDKVTEKTDNAVVAMKEKSAEAGKDLDDAAITASVKTDILKDPDLSVLKIDVDTKDGVVTLNGLANNEAAKSRVQMLASNIKGVKEVRNFLAVKHA